ncbi:MAG: Ig-like domain-containing protein [Candidatus Methanoperedens sp.]|nr:Ig-like domain-containing protein [Candidatus Methanoperedens sp.]
MFRGLLIALILMLPVAMGSSDASDPFENMTEVGTFITHEPNDAEFYEDYLFVADGNSLLVFNTSDPERPELITRFSQFDEPGLIKGLSISRDRLYIAGGPGWIYVLDISDPGNPKRLYQLSYLSSANDVAVKDRYMYVAEANTGMLIFDLSNETVPELAGKFYIERANISGSLQGWAGIALEVSGNLAFLSGEKRSGFYVVDISDVAAPKEVYHSLGKSVYDIAVSGDQIYLARADGTPQYDLMDFSNPYSPRMIDNFTMLGLAERSAIAIHPSGYYIYAASNNRWHIFRIQDTTPPSITIENPKLNETLTSQTISVSGKASDRSGIKEVLVNGKFAGTESWTQTVSLVEGRNSITITASDRNSNEITETLQVTYTPPVAPATPAVTSNVTQPGEEIKSPATFSTIFALVVVLSIVVLGYWFWMRRTKR